MNKVILTLLLGLSFAACQNTPKSASEANTTPTAPAPAPAPTTAPQESIKEAATNLSNGITMMQELRKQVDTLPANVRKAKAKDLEAIYGTLESLIEKQTGMLNEIAPAGGNASQDAAVDGVTTDVVKDYNESAQRYAQEAQKIRAALSEWVK